MAEDPRTLHIRQGFTYRVSFSWMTGGATPVPVPLTGYTVVFSVLRRAGVLPALLSVTSETAFSATEGGVEVEPDGEEGTARITLTAAQTSALIRDAAYTVAARAPDDEPVEYVASGPVDLIKRGE